MICYVGSHCDGSLYKPSDRVLAEVLQRRKLNSCLGYLSISENKPLALPRWKGTNLAHSWPIDILKEWFHVGSSVLASIAGQVDIWHQKKLDQLWWMEVHALGSMYIASVSAYMSCNFGGGWCQRLPTINWLSHFINLVIQCLLVDALWWMLKC